MSAAYERFFWRKPINEHIKRSLENGIGFVDALGRSSVLPLDCVGSWDVR